MFDNVRTIPRKPSDRMVGEGDTCLREKETRRIYAWEAGTDKETWERLKEAYNGYESVGYYDTVRATIV